MLSIFAVFIFFGIGVFIYYFFSQLGWKDLASVFTYHEKFRGKRIWFARVGIGDVSYNPVIFRYSAKGFYLKQKLLFRLFHPPLLIPWKNIRKVTTRTMLFRAVYVLHIGDPHITEITVNIRIFKKLSPYIERIPEPE